MVCNICTDVDESTVGRGQTEEVLQRSAEDSANNLLFDLLFESLEKINDAEMSLPHNFSHHFPATIAQRQRDLDSHPLPFKPNEPLSTSASTDSLNRCD